MINLSEQLKTECINFRNEVYTKSLTTEGIISKEDWEKINPFLKRVGEELEIDTSKYLLDMKCGILFTQEEKRSGIKTLHNHDG